MSKSKYELEIGVDDKASRALANIGARTRRYQKDAQQATNASKRMADGFSHAATSVAILDGPLGGVAGRLSSTASAMRSLNPVLVAGAVAFAGFTAAAASSLTVFAQVERQLSQTESLLRATGNASGQTTAQIDATARQIALDTLADSAGMREAANALLTFKGVSGSVFNDTLRLSQDLASVMGGSAKSAAIQLGKALEDPVRGLASLRRVGVSFTGAQETLIKNMVETGNQAEAQRVILKTLQDQIGGAGAAEAAGLSGAVDTLGQRWEELLEAFNRSTGAGQAATDVINRMARGMQRLGDSIDETEQERINNLFNRRLELQMRLQKLEAQGGQSANRTNGLRQEMRSIDAELESLAQKQMEAAIAANEAAEQGRKVQAERARQAAQEAQAREAEQAKKRLASQQKQGAARLSAMDQQFADEQERINLNWERRNAEIDQLQLSEAEIRRRGFESLEQLQAEYRDRNDAHLDNEFMAVEEKHRQHQQKLTDQVSQQAQARQDVERQYSQMVTGMQMQAAANAAELVKQSAEEGSAAWVAALLVQKGLLVAQALMHANLAATLAANSQLSIPTPDAPARALAAAETMRNWGYLNAALIGATAVAEVAGARERGGSVIGGQTYLVGERGPELFTPGAAGQITSNANMAKAMGGGPQALHITFQVQVNDTTGFDELLMSRRQTITGLVRQAMNDAGMRGGF